MEYSLFKFGDYQLDPGKRELRRDGQRIELQPRVFDLLAYLLEHHQRAVGKDELQDAVWPGMVVTEASLTRAVMKARKAIGDDANTQALIRTIHGHGYRFVSPVETLSAAAPTPVQDEPVTLSKGRPGLLALAALLALLTAFGLYLVIKPAAPLPGDMRLAVLPLEDHSQNAELGWVSLGLMSVIRNSLAGNAELSVVPDQQVVSLSGNFPANAEDDEDGPPAALIKALRESLGVSLVLRTELVSEGPMLRMNYWLQKPDGTSQAGTMVGNDPIALAEGVVQSVHGSLLGRSRLHDRDNVVSSDPFNNEAFARGMNFSLEGRCAEAEQFFRVILEQEPALIAPRLELASCLRILGRPDEAEQLLTGLIADLQQQPALLAQALLVLGVVQNRTARLDEAETSYLEALRQARTAGDYGLAARIELNLAILAKSRGDWAASASYLDQGRVDYERAGLKVMPGYLWSGYANLMMETGELDKADTYLAQALAAFRAAGERRNEAMMLSNTGYLRRLQGRLDEAEPYFLESLAIRQDIQDRVGVGRTHNTLSLLHSARGQHAEALAEARLALDIARETQDRLFEGTALAQLGDAAAALNEPVAARRNYEASRQVFAEFQDSQRVLQVDLQLARLDLDSGQVTEAQGVARQVLAQAREQGHIQPELDALVLLADSELADDQSDLALEALSEALSRAQGSDLEAKESYLLQRLAGLLMDQSRLEEASPLVARLAGLESGSSGLAVRARFAWLSGDMQQGLELMLAARELAGASWHDTQEALLQEMLESGASGTVSQEQR